MKKWHKATLITLGALTFSTLAIQASDMARGIETRLSGLVIESEGQCGLNEVPFLFGEYSLCIDAYEASPGEGCPHKNPLSPQETQENANSDVCTPTTQPGKVPWRFVSLTQAQQFCAREGKRLPTNEEWYRYASGSGDTSSCSIDTKKDTPQETGSAACTTPAGIHDVIGNVWEWVDGQVIEGQYNNRPIPPSGYVALVDAHGVVVQTSENAVEEFGSDYAWTDATGIRGFIRGGFYGSGEDAGVFAQNLSVPLDLKTAGVGFRCARDL